MTLYNARTEGNSLRVTKFNSDMNVEASYLTGPSYCTCPAGVRPTCRHRQMLTFLQMIVDTAAFYDFDRKLFLADDREYTIPPEPAMRRL